MSASGMLRKEVGSPISYSSSVGRVRVCASRRVAKSLLRVIHVYCHSKPKIPIKTSSPHPQRHLHCRSSSSDLFLTLPFSPPSSPHTTSYSSTTPPLSLLLSEAHPAGLRGALIALLLARGTNVLAASHHAASDAESRDAVVTASSSVRESVGIE